MPLAYILARVFVETHAFTVRIRKLLPDDSYRLLQTALAGAPDLGVAELDDLSEAQKAALRRIIETEYP